MMMQQITAADSTNKLTGQATSEVAHVPCNSNIMIQSCLNSLYSNKSWKTNTQLTD